MRFLVSLAYNPTFSEPAEELCGHALTTRRRQSDWGLTGVRKRLHHFMEIVGLLWQARRFDALVLCTVGLEAIIAAALRPLLCPKVKLVIFDFLTPRLRRFTKGVSLVLRQVSGFAVIRRGDVEMLRRRYRVAAERCCFIPFPAPIPPKTTIAPVASESSSEPYIYSAGWAHRDWPTLIRALADLPYPARISAGVPIDVPAPARERIQLLPMLPPEEGREMAAKARVIVLSMHDTELPSGPVVLLDAMMMGKAVVATSVNGTRDYLRNGENGLLTPPSDPAAMRAAIERLMTDAALRERLGAAAREFVAKELPVPLIFDRLIAWCADVAGDGTGAGAAVH